MLSQNHLTLSKEIPIVVSTVKWDTAKNRLLIRNYFFSYEVKESPDGEFGAINDNGEWSGLIGQLKEKVGLKISFRCNATIFFKQVTALNLS